MARRCVMVSVIACVGMPFFAGCGGNSPDRSTGRAGQPQAPVHEGDIASRRTDLRSPDVDGRMDSVSRSTVFSCPTAGRVDVFFDPRGTVAFVSGGRPLAYGTVDNRVVNRACRARGRLHGVPTGALGERDQAITLRCDLPRSVRFELHPIAMAGRAVGSTVAVLMPDLRRILLAAVLETSGSRIYYSRACRRR
jgi:hypothetical protein